MVKLKRKAAKGKKQTVSAKRKRKLSWSQRLTQAERRGKFMKVDYNLANQMRSCAVGERAAQEGLNTKKFFDDVISTRADALSMEFFYAVEKQNVQEARKVFKEIRAMTRKEFLKPEPPKPEAT